MIFDKIIAVVIGILQGLLDLIPDIPAMPEAVSSSAQYIIELAEDGAGVAYSLFGSSMYYFVFTVGIILIAFEPAYHAFHWLLRKLPISSH